MLLQSLAFSREAIAGGEAWRLLSASLAHLSWAHLCGNLAMLAGVALLLRPWSSPLELLGVFAFSALATTTGLYFGSGLQWYVGASGALYGLLAWGTTRLPPSTGPWLALLLVLNVAIDQGRSVSWLGEPLAPEAHYWGLIGGFLLALVSRRRARVTS